MNFIIASLTHLYSKLLHLYPGRFRDEFAEEMQVVFRDSVNEAIKDGILPMMILCLRELGGLPFNVLREFWHEFKRKEFKMTAIDKTHPSMNTSENHSPWDAPMAALPFALFGIVTMLVNFDVAFHVTYSYLVDVYLDLAFNVIVLFGLFFGLIKGVPRWTYSYLGWSLIFFIWISYWFLGVIIGVDLNYFSWQIWIPLLAVFAAALILTRSLTPLFQLVRGIWQDWTLLSLAVYTFVGFMMLDYDENHSPYLIAFIIASTLAICTSVWIFMKSTNSVYRFMTLLSGFATGMIINRISESTWDIAAYYGLPTQPSMPWYDSILDVIVMTGFWGVILLLPVVVGVVRSIVNKEVTT